MKPKLTKPFYNFELPLQSISISGLESYLYFVNRLDISTELVHIITSKPHDGQAMSGWQGLYSLTCLGKDGQLYDVDIRYAWGSEIFKQNLIDHGWSKATLLYTKARQELTRHKIIIYLCENSINLNKKQNNEFTPRKFIIGQYWASIQHIYVSSNLQHPFHIPDFYPRLVGYSTSQHLTQDYPNKTSSLLDKRIKKDNSQTKKIWKQSTQKKPLISVVTVVFNGEEHIEQTIQSVINQLYNNIEYIVVDGGSTDQTIEIIQKYKQQINYWMCEADAGVYHAMNKGISLATGDYIIFLNCADLFMNVSFLNLAINHLTPDISMAVFDTYLKATKKIKVASVNLIKNIISHQICHQSVIYKNKGIFYNLDYPTLADYDLHLKILLQSPKNIKKISMVMSIYHQGGISGRYNHNYILEDRSVKKGRLGLISVILLFPVNSLKLIRLFCLTQLKNMQGVQRS